LTEAKVVTEFIFILKTEEELWFLFTVKTCHKEHCVKFLGRPELKKKKFRISWSIDE